MSFTAHSLFLPNWFVRRRAMAIGIAFSGVGIGAMVLLPWLQTIIIEHGWRASCWAMGLLVILVLGPINVLVRRRPEDMGLLPDGGKPGSVNERKRSQAGIVDSAWAATEWTLARALRTARFWWIVIGYFCALFAWYAVQVHQTKYLVEVGFGPLVAAWALGIVSAAGIPGQIAPRRPVRSDRAGMGVDGRVSWVRDLLRRVDRAGARPVAGVAVRDGDFAGLSWLRADLGHGAHRRGDLRGAALRFRLRHHYGRVDRRRCSWTVGRWRDSRCDG